MQGPRRGCRQRPKTRLGEGETRARMEEWGAGVALWVAKAGTRVQGPRRRGGQQRPGTGIPDAGPASERVGRALTSQPAREPVGTGLADGRPEEFAAGRLVGCERVPFNSQRGEAMEQQLSSCHGHGPRLGDQRLPRRTLGDPLSPVGFCIHTGALCYRVVIPALGRWRHPD